MNLKKQILFVCLCMGWGSLSFAVECGEIQLSLHNGGRSQTLRYRYDTEQMRIDRPGDLIPSPPVNLLNFEQGTLEILHPHNGTWEKGDLDVAAGSITPLGKIGVSAPKLPAMPERPSLDQIPAVSQRPAMPVAGKMPKGMPVPGTLPTGIGPHSGGAESVGINSGMPAMPEFPMPMMGGEEPMTLLSKNQTNELFGFSCRLYEVMIPGGRILELWLCDDPTLPPFHLLLSELSRRHGRLDWREQLTQLLRNEKQFPLRVIFKSEESGNRAEWSVILIKTDLKEQELVGLFDVPEKMHLLPKREW